VDSLSIGVLRREGWAQSSPAERLEALQSLENQLAFEDGRQTPCFVDVSDLGSRTRGVHGFDANGNEFILLNSNLVNDPAATPYQAVETLYHEDRHAHQSHIVQNPELADSPEQLADWQMSDDLGYLGPEEAANFSEYRWQPTELDANQEARRKTDELYQDYFQDEQEYPAYQQGKQQELADDIALAQRELGDDYVEEAHQAMVNNYNAHHGLEQSQGEAERADLNQPPEAAETTPAVESDPAQGEANPESEGYNYGYGY